MRLSEEEKENIEEKATISGLTLSEYMRQAAVTASVKINIIHEPNVDQISDLAYQLKKIGININQIAHKLNGDGEFDSSTKENLNISLSEATELIRMCETILEATYGCP